MTERSPETDFLLSEVARVFGGRIETSTDFEALECSISETVSQTVSAATLKRIWGYVSLQPRQRMSTLNILARYTGRKDFRALCLELQETSSFLSGKNVSCADLGEGVTVGLSWMPDRKVSLLSKGEGHFEVLDAGSSKLRQGDIVACTEFILGQPVYMSVVRNGQALPPYVAGRAKGITGIELH